MADGPELSLRQRLLQDKESAIRADERAKVLDEIANETNRITDRDRDPVRDPAEWWSMLVDFVDEMREALR